MARRLSFALLLVCLLPVCLSAREKRFGYCQLQNTGGRVTNCTVEVFVTGTLSHPPNGIFQDNLGTPQANPFTASSTSGLWSFYSDNGRYDVQFSGGSPTISPPYTLSDYLFLDLGLQALQATAFQSASANIAQSGIVQLAAADKICWRNITSNGDNCLSQDGSNRLAFSQSFTGAFLGSQFTTTSASPAIGGILRLSTGDSINWRNNASSADVTLSKDSFDNLVWQNGLKAAYFVTQSANPAATFQYRLASTDGISWRNSANSADIALSKGTGDNLIWPTNGISSPAFASLSPNPASTGVIRLANQDTIVSRNAANNGDVVLLTNDSQGYTDVGPVNGFVLLGGSVQATGFGGTPTISPFNGVLSGNGTSFTVAANGGAGLGSHTGGNLSLIPGSGNNGGASGVILLGSGTTVALLPPAAANSGGVMYVTDSTSIAAEGQTCVGASSTKALAFSNGLIWKCF